MKTLSCHFSPFPDTHARTLSTRYTMSTSSWPESPFEVPPFSLTRDQVSQAGTTADDACAKPSSAQPTVDNPYDADRPPNPYPETWRECDLYQYLISFNAPTAPRDREMYPFGIADAARIEPPDTCVESAFTSAINTALSNFAVDTRNCGVTDGKSLTDLLVDGKYSKYYENSLARIQSMRDPAKEQTINSVFEDAITAKDRYRLVPQYYDEEVRKSLKGPNSKACVPLIKAVLILDTAQSIVSSILGEQEGCGWTSTRGEVLEEALQSLDIPVRGFVNALPKNWEGQTDIGSSE